MKLAIPNKAQLKEPIPQINIQMQEVTDIFHQNINLLTKNASSIPDLYTKTQSLSAHSKLFKKSSNKVKRQARLRVNIYLKY